MTQTPWAAPTPGHRQPGQPWPEQPADPGRPGFTQPEGELPGHAQPGHAPPGYGQPGYGHHGYYGDPGDAQPGYYAQPGYAQPGYAHGYGHADQRGYPTPGQAGFGYPGHPAPGPRAGWPPGAPAPGAVPLRPLGIGDILSGAFTLVRQNPAATLGLTASAVTGTAMAMGVIFFIASQTAAAVMFLAVPPALLFFGLQLGGLVAAMGQSLLGRKITIREAVRQSRPGWVILAMLLLVGVFTAIWIPLLLALKGWGVIPVLLLTAWLGVMLSLTIPVVVLEKRGPIAAIGRSWRLVLGSYWRVLGIYLLMYLITWVLSVVISIPLQLFAGLAGGLGATGVRTTFSLALGVSAIGEIVISSLIVTIETGVLVLVYADMRMRKEGMDLVLQQAAQKHRLTGEEFAATGMSSAYTGGAYPGIGARGQPGQPWPAGGYPGNAAAGGIPAGPPGT